jgi:hypothetical protein
MDMVAPQTGAEVRYVVLRILGQGQRLKSMLIHELMESVYSPIMPRSVCGLVPRIERIWP